MISIDTNIIVRFLTKDDKRQFKKAQQVFRQHSVFISETVILESEWVLRYAYEFSAKDIADAFEKLFGLPNIKLDHPVKISQTIGWHRQGLDFADALHLANSQQYEKFITFDSKLVNKAKSLAVCHVALP